MQTTIEVLSHLMLWAGALGIVAGAAYKLLARRTQRAAAANEDPGVAERRRR